MTKTGIKRGYGSIDHVNALKNHIEGLEANLAAALDGLKKAEREIDRLALLAYPWASTMDDLCRKKVLSENPARLARKNLWRIGSD